MDVLFLLVRPRTVPADPGDCEEVKQIYGILERFATFRRPGAFLVDVIPELADSWLFNLVSPWKRGRGRFLRRILQSTRHFGNE